MDGSGPPRWNRVNSAVLLFWRPGVSAVPSFPSLGDLAIHQALQIDPDSELDDVIEGQAEVVDAAVRVAREEREDGLGERAHLAPGPD